MKKVLVTVGTTIFDSLIKAADDQLSKKFNLTFQIADGKYMPEEHQYIRYSNDIEQYFKDADLVISHGGAGTIFRILELDKKLVIVPNLERVDPHQLDICNFMSRHQHAAVCLRLEDLSGVVENAFKTDYISYHTDEFTGVANIRKYLKLDATSIMHNEDD